MHPDDLKAIWICHECKMKFVFHSDTADHKSLTRRKLQETEKTFIKRGPKQEVQFSPRRGDLRAPFYDQT